MSVCLPIEPSAAEPDVSQTLVNQFVHGDLNSDGMLDEAEYLRSGQRDIQRLRREFRTFDADGDSRLSRQEFLTIPCGQPDELRADIADPVVQLLETASKFMTDHWNDWDLDRDGSLDATEFETSVIGQYVCGLESTTLRDWDLDRNGKTHRGEVRRLLEISHGVRRPEGDLLRSKSGLVIDWQLYRLFKQQNDGFVKRDEYERIISARNDRKNWFDSIHRADRNGFLFADFATSPHRYDPADVFLELDIDGDATLSLAELDDLPDNQFPVASFLLPAFDDNRDGTLSLFEFRLTPTANPLAAWQSAVDKDGDGKLSRDEFQFHPDLPLRSLSGEYFRRLDLDKDDRLSPDEFTFVTTHRSLHENKFHLVTAGKSTSLAIPAFEILRSPEISPSGTHLAICGWEAGQNNFASHVLIIDLETEEVRDLGSGYLPNWSADGRRLAYSRYGEGVFIRPTEDAEGQEETIDTQGAGLRFSPDGRSTVYVKRNKLIIHDVNLGLNRTLFDEQESPYRSIEPAVAWSPDSKRLCLLGHRRDGQSEIAIISVTDQHPAVRVACDGRHAFASFAWHPTEGCVMFPQQERGRQQVQIFTVDPDQPGKPRRFPEQPKHRNSVGLCWSRDGKSFVFVSERS